MPPATRPLEWACGLTLTSIRAAQRARPRARACHRICGRDFRAIETFAFTRRAALAGHGLGGDLPLRGSTLHSRHATRRTGGGQLRGEEPLYVCGLAGERCSWRGRPKPRWRGTALLNGPGARRDPAAEHDGFEHAAALQDVIVVLGGNERLAVAVPEHEGVEGGEQQTGWRFASGPGVGVALRAGGVERPACLRDG